MNNPIAALVDDLKTQIETVELVQKKVLKWTDLETLIASDFSKLTSPAITIAYEGLRSTDVGNPDGRTHRIGLSAEAQFGVYVAFRDPAVFKVQSDYIDQTVEIMDSLRDVLKNRRSPLMHFWRFVSEFPSIPQKGLIIWVQRWATPVQLTA